MRGKTCKTALSIEIASMKVKLLAVEYCDNLMNILK